MSEQDIYKKVISIYKETESINDTVSQTGLSKVKVQRILITEGLWCSRSSLEIGELFVQGLTTEEIAEKLHMTVKNVQAYIPYSRGVYGNSFTNDAEWSSEYRERMRLAAKRMKRGKSTEIKVENIPEITDDMKNFDIPVECEANKGRVLRLRLELVDSYSKQPELDNDALILAKAEKSISRTVFVPGNMTLHSMHYMLQKLFGWQNSHLHNFSLPDDVFEELTEDKTNQWTELVGTLFYLHDEDVDDSYADDDYIQNKSFKTWLKHKYTNNDYLSVCSTYSDNMRKIRNLGEHIDFTAESSLKEIIYEQNPNYLLENLRINELMKNSSDDRLSVTEWKTRILSLINDTEKEVEEFTTMNKKKVEALNEAVRQLLTWRMSYCNLLDLANETPSVVKEKYGMTSDEAITVHKDSIQYWSSASHELFKLRPKLIPNVSELFYHYDYGDSWCVKITCEEVYDRIDYMNFQTKDGWSRVDVFTYDDARKKFKYKDSKGLEVREELRQILVEIDIGNKPICVETDGLNVFDDVGGIYGFIEFLKGVNDKSNPEREETLNWARFLGWTGRKSRPENML